MSADRRHSCTRKHKHASEGAAKAHLRALQKLGKEDVRTVAYACRYCRGWHVGRKPLNASEKASA